MKILLLDIETSPNLAYVWRIFKENIGINQIAETGSIICYSAKWYQDSVVFYDSIKESDHAKFLKGLHRLLSEADVLVHYNGTRFDIPTINTAFAEAGIKPPSSYQQVDLLKVVRTQFRFLSNKMAFVAQKLGVGKKRDTTFELWKGCIEGREEAWEEMYQYNLEDLMILERLYTKLLPWIKNHPNHGLFNEEGLICPTCSSNEWERRGFMYTKAGRYQRYSCNDCGSWFRSRTCDDKHKETFRIIT